MYLDDKANGRKAVRLNTLEGYQSAMRAHVLPRWGQVEVESVSYEDVQSWVDSFDRGAEKAAKTFRQAIRWAIAKRVVVMADPTVGIEVTKPTRRSARVLRPGELNQLLYKCKGEPWEAAVWVQANTGLRRCEMAALTWADVDLRSGVVHVTKGRHVVGGKVYVWGTKTEASTRDVPLPHFAVLRLRQIRKERRARPDELLCDLRPDAMSRRFRSWCNRNGFCGFSLMQLRHTWATIAVQSGVPIEVVAMTLGHVGLEMAFQRYVTRSVDLIRAAQRKFADTVLRAAPRDRMERHLTPVLVA
jgi:integrase